MILSPVRLTRQGVWIGSCSYWSLYHTTRDYNLQTNDSHRLVFSVTVFTALLGSGYQRRTFPHFLDSQSSFYSLGTNSTENMYSIIAYSLVEGV